MPYKNIEDQKESDRKRYEKNKETIKHHVMEYYYKNKKRIRERRLELSNRHKIKNNERERIRYANLRQEILDVYGRECACCGEKETLFLELDHVNNDGKEHRIKLKMGGAKATYRDVKKHNYPKDYQLLCANCNQGKRRNRGICPHKKKSL